MSPTPKVWRCLECGAHGTAPTLRAREAALYDHWLRVHNAPETVAF